MAVRRCKMKRFEKLKQRIRRKKTFLRITTLYLVGSVLLLAVFSTILTYVLTARTMEKQQAAALDSVNQAYSMTNYILSDAYDSFHQLYKTFDMTNAMFSTETSVEDELALAKLLERAGVYSSCVDSIYVINKQLDKVYTNAGIVSAIDEFYDRQALQLFEYYNENSSTIFLPRSTSFSLWEGDDEQTHNFDTLIFAKKDALLNVQGGLIINLNQSKLHSLITADISSPEYMYIVSQNGSILSSFNEKQINTTLQGTKLWKTVEENANKSELTFNTNYDGRDCLVTCRKADKLMFSFLYIVPKAQITAGVAYIRSFTLSILAVFMVLAFFVAMLCSRNIYNPISKLVSTMRSSGKALQGSGQDELSFLGSAYESLCTELEEINSGNSQMYKAQLRELLSRLLRAEFATEEKCRAEAEKFPLLIKYPQYLVAVISFDGYAKLTADTTMQDLALYRYALFNVVSELFGTQCTVFNINDDPQNVTLVINLQNTGAQTLHWAKDVLTGLLGVTKKYLPFTVSCGIGTVENALLGLSQSFEAALTAVGYRLVMGCGSVTAYSDISIKRHITPEYPNEDEAALINAVRSRSEEKASAAIDAFFAKISVANVDYINMSVSQLAITLSRVAKSLSISSETQARMNYRYMRERLQACDTLEQYKLLVLRCCCEIIDSRNSEVQSKKEELTDRICTFIETNYTNPLLNVEDVASYAELSVNYLRTMFKAAVGKSPSDYLVDTRINKAKELLETTNYSTIEIATAVGYYNHRYFYSVFKSKTGTTPTEYRTRFKKGEGEA